MKCCLEEIGMDKGVWKALDEWEQADGEVTGKLTVFVVGTRHWRREDGV